MGNDVAGVDIKGKSWAFRDYHSSAKNVKETYAMMHENQNLIFVKSMKETYASNGYVKATGQKIYKHIASIYAALDKIIDESDPDTHLPQIYHAYQTGEALRTFLDCDNPTQLKKDIVVNALFSATEWKRLPIDMQLQYATYLHQHYADIKDWSWLPLIGFLHDAGKVLATAEWGALPQWAVVGDTFPVGAPFSSSNVFFEHAFYSKNADLKTEKQSNKQFGIYPSNCGFEHIHMSWGHDEYLYAVLNRTSHYLPAEALYIIRFHSFYPWHTPRNGIRGYEELASPRDWHLLPLLKMFQTSDLYSKKTVLPDIKQLENYYFGLFEHFVLGDVTTNTVSKSMQLLW